MTPRARGLALGVLVALAGAACGGRPAPPAGPPPEYQRPVLAPWTPAASASAAPDPLDEAAEGGWVGGED